VKKRAIRTELKGTLAVCLSCLDKQREIDRLQDENKRLKDLVRRQDRTIKEGPFGSSTPSSMMPFKGNSLEENQKKKGGANKGHKGHGRSSIDEKEADITYEIEAPSECPHCGVPLEKKGTKERSILDCLPIRTKKVVYYLEQKRCPKCRKTISAKAPGIMPNFLFSNNLISYICTQHYVFGNTLGQISHQLGVSKGSIIKTLHKTSKIFKDVPEKLEEEYRMSAVKHADETSWRIDGKNGYTYIFDTDKLSIYKFHGTRAASVANGMFDGECSDGVLVVDRYNGYNNVPSKIQYCYAHLLRDTRKTIDEFPDNDEVKCFVETLSPLLKDAMKLRSSDISDNGFLKKASILKEKIIEVTNREARHPAIQYIQNIFRDKSERMYHWASDRAVPADNNLAERDLRQLVIARKISQGSQSQNGAATREILMTVLHTLRKRNKDTAESIKNALDAYSENTKLDLYKYLFEPNSS
jgi:transposase